jgi:hypothetical protein
VGVILPDECADYEEGAEVWDEESRVKIEAALTELSAVEEEDASDATEVINREGVTKIKKGGESGESCRSR